MVRTWCHKRFSQGQSGAQRGARRARVRQRLMQIQISYQGGPDGRSVVLTPL